MSGVVRLVNYQEKKVRRAYRLSVILFCTNNQCCIPLHLLLADVIESCGGSADLLSILNRVGAVASFDTLKRHICEVSLVRKEEGLLAHLSDGSFTVSSTDNIDFLQPHAAVYAGSQHRSCHATSTQIVQPKPQLLRQSISTSGSVPHTASCVALSGSAHGPHGPSTVHCNQSTVMPLHLKRSERSSPINTPAKQTRSPSAKRLRRARTFVEAEKLKESHSFSEGNIQLQVRGSAPDSRNTSFCLADFLTNEAETIALNDLQQMLFTYLMLKISLSGTLTL